MGAGSLHSALSDYPAGLHRGTEDSWASRAHYTFRDALCRVERTFTVYEVHRCFNPRKGSIRREFRQPPDCAEGHFVVDLFKRLGEARPTGSLPTKGRVGEPSAEWVGKSREVRAASEFAPREDFEVEGHVGEGVDQHQAPDLVAQVFGRHHRKVAAAAISHERYGKVGQAFDFLRERDCNFFDVPVAAGCGRVAIAGKVYAVEHPVSGHTIEQRLERAVVSRPPVYSQVRRVPFAVTLNVQGPEPARRSSGPPGRPWACRYRASCSRQRNRVL